MRFIISMLFCLILGVFFQFGNMDSLNKTIDSTVETQFTDSENFISHKDFYLNIDEVFIKNKDTFMETSNILSKIEKDIKVVFDEDKNCISQVNIDNTFYKGEEIFDATEIIVISKCFSHMKHYAPDFMSISLNKLTDVNGIEKIVFLFSGNFCDEEYIDIGIVYCESDLSEEYIRICDNWYKYKFALV